MTAQITELIDKQDNFEIVGAQIAAILALEIANQQALAVVATLDPAPWKLRIFRERSNPWEQYLIQDPDPSPLVNVWYDSSNFDGKASNVSDRQKARAVFNIDCYGYGISEDDGAGGHLPGDRVAALAVHRALRLVRNILMSAQYTYLGFPKESDSRPWKRWPQTITVFQPEQEKATVPQIIGARIAFAVEFNELAPQVVGDVLELVSVVVTEDGEIVLEADYPATP